MKLQDILDEYGTYYKFCKKLGWQTSIVAYWVKIGYIPIKRQHIIEQKTHGKLRANIEDDKSV